MRRKRFSLSYWTTDVRAVTAWITIAFVAGAGPNLIGAIGPLYLLAAAIVAATVAAPLVRADRRRVGVGVFVDLPTSIETVDTSLKAAEMMTLRREMTRRHRDWFRAGPDRPQLSRVERVSWTMATISYRLAEARPASVEYPELFLYLRCRLPEAFLLGQRASLGWSGVMTSREDVLPPFGLRVRTLSTYGDRLRIHEMVVSDGRRQPASRPLAQSVSALPVTEQPARLAVIISTAANQKEHDNFVKRALRAAQGESVGYVIEHDDACDYALSIWLTKPEELQQRLSDGSSGAYLSVLRSSYDSTVRQVYGHRDIPARVFTAAPAIIAFGVGSLFPQGSRLIPFDPVLAAVARPSPETSMSYDYFAIIDGDDVGVTIERSLLEGDLVNAVAHSRSVDEATDRLVSRLRELSGVRERSRGGDSVIFELSQTAVQPFVARLEEMRSELRFNVSCGVGADCREAYLSLRLAKTSGKNLTVGADDVG